MPIAGEITKQYLRRFPHASSLQIARKIKDEHPLVFDDIENARRCVRYYRGAIGKKNRSKVDDEFIRPIEEAIEKQYNPFGFPDAVNEKWSPVGFPVKKGRGLILADLHIPYHDIEALTLATKWGLNNEYKDFVLLLGDVQDCYDISKFEKNPERRTYKTELDDVNKFLDALESLFPKALIIFKRGNHDRRLEFYLRRKAVEIFDLSEFIWTEKLRIKQRGIFVVEEDSPITVGKLNIIHGHELQATSTAVNAARGAYLKAVDCILLGHWHRSSMHPETSFSGRLDTAWSIGCLCGLHPEHARINKWNHGVAGLEVDGDDFEVENKRIFKGMVR